MPYRICLDNEDVCFEGDAPQRVQDVLFFLEDFLKQQQRQLSKVSINEQPLSFSDFATSTQTLGTLKCESQAINNAKISGLLIDFKQNIACFSQVLIRDTEQILQLAQEFTQALLNLLNTLKEESYLLSIIHEPLYLQWIEAFAQTLEDKDFGLTYDIINTSLLPLLEETQKQCL